MSSQLNLIESADFRLFQFVRKITRFFGSMFICQYSKQEIDEDEEMEKGENEIETNRDSLTLFDSVITSSTLPLEQSNNSQKMKMPIKQTKISFYAPPPRDIKRRYREVDLCNDIHSSTLLSSRKMIKINNLSDLKRKIERLLYKFDVEIETEPANSPDEECVICVTAKATMQTYPCGHKVVCRKCFVKTIQMVVNERVLPLRCVICRAKILRLMLPSTPDIVKMYYETSNN